MKSVTLVTILTVVAMPWPVAQAEEMLPEVPVVQLTPLSALTASQKTNWWAAFNDPLMDTLAPELLAQNLDLKIAQSRVDESRALITNRRASLFPDISLGGTASRGNDKVGQTSPATIAQGGFDAAWEIDVFGRNRAATSAAENRSEAIAANKDDVQNSLIAELMRAITEWRRANETLAQTKSLLASQDDQVKLFASRTKAGLIDATFLERAKAQAAQTAVQLPVAEAAALAAQYAIERLLGKPSGALTEQLQPHQNAPLVVPSLKTTLQVPMEVIRARPDVRAKYAEMIAAQSDLAVSEAELWPRISVSAFFGLQDGSNGVLIADNPIWSTASNITMPILNFGRLRSAVDASNARAIAASLAYENAVLLALQEAHTALSDYSYGMDALHQQELTLTSRKDAVMLAKMRFDRGLTDMIDLTTAQSELDLATITLVDRKAATANAYIRLQKALAVGIKAQN